MKPVKAKEVPLGTLKAGQYFYVSDLGQYGQVVNPPGPGSVRVRLWTKGKKSKTLIQNVRDLAYATPVVVQTVNPFETPSPYKE